MRVVAALTAVSALAAMLVSCASDAGSPSPRSSSSVSDSAQPSRSASAEPTRVQVTIGDDTFGMTLDDSAASRDLVRQLPLTLEMQDHGSVEKTARLPRALSLEGQPAGADPDPADVGYYAPGNDLVLYHGDQSYYPGIVLLGRMDQRAADRIGGMPGSITATVTLLPS